MVHDIWVEVDTQAMKHNLLQVRGQIAPTTRIMAVVKGNAYGHGALESARVFVENGAEYLAVTRLEEALALRAGGIESPILLLAPVQPENASAAVANNLDITVSSQDLAQEVQRAASSLREKAGVHIKIDTGMGRIGAPPEQAAELARAIAYMPDLRIRGVFTHLATAAEKDIRPSLLQIERFQRALRAIDDAGVDYGMAHASNSAGLGRVPEFDMVRPGTVLYGQYPSGHLKKMLKLKPTWRLKARICELKTLPAKHPIGYGGEFVTKRETRIAVIAIGFAEGFTMVPEGPIYRKSLLKFALTRARRRLVVEVRGKKAPVIGRVAMQMTILDVTHIPGVCAGDEVIIPALRIPVSALIPRVYV